MQPLTLARVPGQDLYLNEDGDYCDDGAGAFITTETAAPALRHQLLGLLGQWVGDSTAGRDRQSISGRNSSEAEADREADGILKALTPLEEDGLIDDIEITVERDGSRWLVQVTCRDTQSGGTIAFDNLQSFGA
jgi:hypothetical protein